MVNGCTPSAKNRAPAGEVKVEDKVNFGAEGVYV